MWKLSFRALAIRQSERRRAYARNVINSVDETKLPFHVDRLSFLNLYDYIFRVELGSEEFSSQLHPFLGDKTEHFIYEFLSFARSPFFEITDYDEHAQYSWPSESEQEPRGTSLKHFHKHFLCHAIQPIRIQGVKSVVNATLLDLTFPCSLCGLCWPMSLRWLGV